MARVVHSSEYSDNFIFVGGAVNEHGEPLVEINRKAVGTVAGLLEFIGKYRGQHNEKIYTSLSANIGQGYKPVELAEIQITIEGIESWLAERVEKAMRSANRRNIKKT
jgi:hypothetical protein